jgi:hypothetical protein
MKIRFVVMDAPGGSRVRGIPVFLNEWSDERIGQLAAVYVQSDDVGLDTDIKVEDLRSEPK